MVNAQSTFSLLTPLQKCGGVILFVRLEKEKTTMAKGKNSSPAATKTTTDRKNGKASKKRPKIFDAVKRRLVTLKK